MVTKPGKIEPVSNTLYGEVQGHITEGGALVMQREPVRVSQLLLVISFFIVTTTLVGCNDLPVFQNDETKDLAVIRQQPVTVYYVTQEGDYLVPVNTKVSLDDDICRYVVERVLAGPHDTDLREALSSPFPRGVLLKYIYVKDGRVCVDLGGEAIGTMDPKLWRQALSSLVFTLTEMPDVDIKSIEVLVNGVPGNNMVLERPAYINLIPGEPDDGLPITVFFSYNDTCLVPVTVKLAPETTDVLKATLDQLVAGPRGIPYLSSVFPEGTRLLDYRIEGDLLSLNFSKEAVLRDIKGNIRKEEQSPTVGSLALTLRRFAGIDCFEILIEGTPLIEQKLKVPRSYLDLENITKAQPEQG
jgi:germination protein M